MRSEASRRQRDNGSGVAKARLRSRLAASLPADARILEGFAGEGHLYRVCWRPFGGATIDRDDAKARASAIERPSWAVYRGDTEKALLFGWLGKQIFDVVDLDCYGSPWLFVRAWFLGVRARAAVTTLILTDGYLARASLSWLDATLFGGAKRMRQNVSPQLYHETAAAKLSSWASRAGEQIASFDTYVLSHRAHSIQMHAHVVVTTRGTGKE